MSIDVLCVAEKPSIAEAIARALAPHGQYHTRMGGLKVHEFTAMFLDKGIANFKVAGVFGHIFGTDFPPQYNSWDAIDPVQLFSAPVIKKEEDKKHVTSSLQHEARGCDYVVLWLDCDREGENICFEVISCVEHVLRHGRASGPQVFFVLADTTKYTLVRLLDPASALFIGYPDRHIPCDAEPRAAQPRRGPRRRRAPRNRPEGTLLRIMCSLVVAACNCFAVSGGGSLQLDFVSASPFAVTAGAMGVGGIAGGRGLYTLPDALFPEQVRQPRCRRRLLRSLPGPSAVQRSAALVAPALLRAFLHESFASLLPVDCRLPLLAADAPPSHPYPDANARLLRGAQRRHPDLRLGALLVPRAHCCRPRRRSATSRSTAGGRGCKRRRGAVPHHDGASTVALMSCLCPLL